MATETINCRWCGSNKHRPEVCPIRQKVTLAEMGIPVEHLFDAVVEVNHLEDLPRIVEGLRKKQP